MTIAIGAKIPWGAIPSPAPTNEAVLLIADTRYTYPVTDLSQLGRRTNDYGRKIFRLRRFAAIALAGDVPAAEQAVVWMRERLPNTANPPIDSVLQVAEDSCKAAFARIGRKQHGMWILIGGRERSGHGYLVYTSSEQSFVPILLPGQPFSIGPEAGKRRLSHHVQGLEQSKMKEGKVTRTAADWLNLLYAATDFTVRDRVDSKIGGRVQAVVISEDGVWEHEMAVLEKVAMPPEKDTWRMASHKLEVLSGHSLAR